MGYVIGVGGFLGMGEHDIFVEPAKIKFVNEPVRAIRPRPPPTTRRRARRPPRAMQQHRRARARTTWYPDHGVLSATKDQLKAMPQFKYSSYN